LQLVRSVVAAAASVDARFTPTRVSDLRLAVSEAATNAMESHAQMGSTERVVVRCQLDEDRIERAWWGPRPAELQAWFKNEGQAFDAAERYRRLRRWYARDRGRLERLILPLFQAYFVRGQNLHDEGVLGQAAEAAGLDREEALAAVREGRYAQRLDEHLALAGRYGIHSVPTFIVNDRYKIVGAHPYDVLRDALRRIAQEG
ncbi:MAG: DsbA family protein, partial [Symbiobacteriaceae bacterium]